MVLRGGGDGQVCWSCCMGAGIAAFGWIQLLAMTVCEDHITRNITRIY